MDDLILRSAALAAVETVPYTGDQVSIYDIKDELKKLPAVDAVEVVRCKDCKHWHEELGWCDKHSHFTDADGEFCHPWESTEWKMFDAEHFCKDGERRADDAVD